MLIEAKEGIYIYLNLIQPICLRRVRSDKEQKLCAAGYRQDLDLSKPIVMVGLDFDTAAKNIRDWKMEIAE